MTDVNPPRRRTARVRTRPTRGETRERLLAAALDVFGEQGIAGATVSDVAARAGMTKGAVYSNFAGKDELVLTMMEQHTSARTRAALDAVAVAGDLAEAIDRAGAALFGALRDDAVWHRLLAEYFALAHRDVALRDGLRRSRVEARAGVATVLTELFVTLGIDPPMPVPELTLAIFALSNGLGMEMGMDPDAPGDDVFGRVLGLVFGDAVRAVRDGHHRPGTAPLGARPS